MRCQRRQGDDPALDRERRLAILGKGKACLGARPRLFGLRLLGLRLLGLGARLVPLASPTKPQGSGQGWRRGGAGGASGAATAGGAAILRPTLTLAALVVPIVMPPAGMAIPPRPCRSSWLAGLRLCARVRRDRQSLGAALPTGDELVAPRAFAGETEAPDQGEALPRHILEGGALLDPELGIPSHDLFRRSARHPPTRIAKPDGYADGANDGPREQSAPAHRAENSRSREHKPRKWVRHSGAA
mmetsp:Transcript_110780/g.318368  ORF Transcript_110780/g.318368 Transcript_110780/m.318368 type:complete len:244 (-) Transcript_110780:1544-2275(-)